MTGLNDKTVVLAGPFSLLIQNLITRITEYGADVAVFTDDVKSAQRVCQNIMDMREVSEKFGRAAALEVTYGDTKAYENNFSRSAEIFGSTDIFIDTHLFGLRLPHVAAGADANNANTAEFDKTFAAAFEPVQALTKVASMFIKGRTRGRILYLIHELDMLSAQNVSSPCFTELKNYIHQLGVQLSSQNIAVNGLAIGANEDYLLSRFSKTLTIQKSLQELQKTLPHARLVDYNDIANFVCFLASPGANGLSGQMVQLNHAL